jgi:hypothetical protein
MKSNFDNFVSILSELGIGWKYLINGLIGGVVYAVYNKSKIWDALRQVFIGGMVSAYTTPLIAAKLSIDYVGFLSFVIGLVGMVVIDSIIKWIIKKIKLLF